jgi:hypothetical protein
MKKALLLAALLGAAACDDGATDIVIEYLPPSVRVEVSGGLAGIDYAFVHTSEHVLFGVRCGAFCDFESGDTLHVLTELQAGLVDAALADAGRTVGAHDFGVPCCDMIEYRLTFQDGPEVGTVRGTGETLPDAYHRLVTLLDGLHRGVVPILVDDGQPVEGAPDDAVEILEASLEAPLLDLTVRYSGGCARHAFDLVVASGWKESYPVQVDVDLAHEDPGDPCDALPTETLRFDLTPLREAYVEAYGSGPGAIAMQLGAASGGPRTTVTWSF